MKRLVGTLYKLILVLNEQFKAISLLLLPPQGRVRPERPHHRPPPGRSLRPQAQLAGTHQIGRPIPSPRAQIQTALRGKGNSTLTQAHADADFKERHDLALRTISQLKNEIDALRADLREKNLEINDLESDENTLIGQLDQRAIEIEKLKN